MEERIELLKSLGYSDAFLKHILANEFGDENDIVEPKLVSAYSIDDLEINDVNALDLIESPKPVNMVFYSKK